ncbi:MAG: hypothetical protein ABJP48_09445 [Erythrobacter sp.]
MTDYEHRCSGVVGPVILTLEAQLSHLDRIGAFVAAAHVDAAINQLRVEYSSGVEGPKPPKPPAPLHQ